MQNFLRKISSRKLWAAVVGVAVGLAAIFGVSESEWTQIAGIVTSAASVIAYIVGEAKVDASREANTISIEGLLDKLDEIEDAEEEETEE